MNEVMLKYINYKYKMTSDEAFSPLVTYIVGFLFALVYLGEIPLGSLRSLIGRMILIALFAILLLVVIVFYLIMNPLA